jgi:hypothetical protein
VFVVLAAEAGFEVAGRDAAAWIKIQIHRRPAGQRWDRRSLLFGAVAFEVYGVHQPAIAALHNVIAWTPGFTDCPWQAVCDGRVKLSGPSARKMARLRVEEGDQDTRFRRNETGTGAIDAGPDASAAPGLAAMEG